MGFHVHRQTGALLRAIDRGCRGISTVINALLFNLGPTALELGLVCGVFAWRFGPAFAGCALGTVACYAAFTLAVTQWRTQHRKDINVFENQASSVSTDSLLNLETVKCFGNEVGASPLASALLTVACKGSRVGSL